MAINENTLAAVAQIRRDLDAMSRAQTVALTRAWVEAWDALGPEFTTALVELLQGSPDPVVRAAVVRKNARLQQALKQARATLVELARTTGEIAVKDAAQVVLDAVSSHAAIVGSQLPPGAAAAGVSFTRTSPEALAWIVERTTQQIHSAARPLPAEVVRLMRQELVRGIAVGENPRRTAERLVKRAETRFNGGLTRALTIARTETLDAHRAATQASEKTNKDILAEWEWFANLDRRTCPSCIAKHGQHFPLSEPGPDDHQNGRCTRITVTKSWAELGFKNITEPEPITQDSKAWFENLTLDTQRAIMGPARLELLNSGKITWDDLSQKVETPGWRDSYRTPSVKSLV